MPHTILATELWIIGPTEPRHRAMQALQNEHGDYLFSPVFHTTQGHDVASVVQAFRLTSLVDPGILETVKNHPGLSWVLSYVTNDHAHASDGYTGHVNELTCHDDGRTTVVKPGILKSSDQSFDEILNALREHWYPRALRKMGRVPVPQGSALQRATWQDHGTIVARLLADPTVRPDSDDQETWWTGLATAVRERAHKLPVPCVGQEVLDGRSLSWSRSASDAWLEAFPSHLRDLDRAIDLLQYGDMACIAGLMHWGVPAHAMYRGMGDDRIGVTLVSGDPDDRSDGWDVLRRRRTLLLPERLSYADRMELLCHDRLLGCMASDERERLLNGWVGHLSDTGFTDEATIAREMVPLLDRWHRQGLLPEDWFTAETMGWINATGMAGRADGRWFEAETLKKTLAKENVLTSVRKTRARL